MTKKHVEEPKPLPENIAEAVARLRASSPPHDETQAEALALVLDHVDPPKEAA